MSLQDQLVSQLNVLDVANPQPISIVDFRPGQFRSGRVGMITGLVLINDRICVEVSWELSEDETGSPVDYWPICESDQWDLMTVSGNALPSLPKAIS